MSFSMDYSLERSVEPNGRRWHVMWPELLVAGGLLGATFLFNAGRNIQTLQTRFDKIADTNRDGKVSPTEMGDVYATLGLDTNVNGRTYVPKLSTQDMERYIASSTHREKTTYKNSN